MDIETTIQEMSGSYYIRIPAIMAEYLKLDKFCGAKSKKKAKVKDITISKIEITFPSR